MGGTPAVSNLRRSGLPRGDKSLERDAASAGAGAVPPPKWRWKTRLLLPLAILAAVAGILFYTARDSLRPAVQVKVVPVVARSGGAVAGGMVITQAPGWVEPD